MPASKLPSLYRRTVLLSKGSRHGSLFSFDHSKWSNAPCQAHLPATEREPRHLWLSHPEKGRRSDLGGVCLPPAACVVVPPRLLIPFGICHHVRLTHFDPPLTARASVAFGVASGLLHHEPALFAPTLEQTAANVISLWGCDRLLSSASHGNARVPYYSSRQSL